MAEEDLKRHFEDMGWTITKKKAGHFMMSNVKPSVTGPIHFKPECLVLDGKRPKGEGTLHPVKHREFPLAGANWRRMSMSVDSGAIDTVVPPDTFPGEVVSTLATQSGFVYYGAEGSDIPHMGEQDIQGLNRNGRGFKMKAQVAPVTKPLCAVNKMLAAGNRVVFDSEPDGTVGANGPACYIINKATGEVTPIENRGGDFQLDLFIPVQGGEVQGAQQLATVSENRSGEQSQTFLRHV